MLFLFRAVFFYFVLFPFVLQSANNKNNEEPTTLVFPSFLHTMGIRKATKTHLMLYTGNKVKVNNPRGLAVVRLKSWDDPDEIKDDDEVTGYGINSGMNVIVYNKSMSSLGFYGLNETGERRLNNPTAVTANENGDVFVADTGNHRIIRFYNERANLKFVKAIGGKGAVLGKFNSPAGVALDSNNMLYVSDTGNHRIQIIRPDGQVHLWFGDQGVEEGELWHPTRLAVTTSKERWSFFKDSFMVVIDLDGKRVQKFTLDGKFMAAVSLKDFAYQSGQLSDLAIDYYNNIWVTDFSNHCIHKFDRNLHYITTFGKHGTGKREFIEPRAIAIYKRFGQVFIVERESAQYYWIGTDIFDFEARWLKDKKVFELDFILTEPSFISLEVAGGGTKRKVFEKRKYFTGERKIFLNTSWRTSATPYMQDHPTPKSGLEYKFKLKVEPTYSSYKYFSKEVEAKVRID